MNYTIPNSYTQQDWINAGVYAKYKLNKVKSENEEFKKAFPGTGWVVDKNLQSINCPSSLTDCPNVFGRSKFLTKQACLEQSGDYKDQGQGKKPYLEWREPGTEQGGENGKCVFGNFSLRNWCENPSSRRAGQKVRGVTDVPPFQYDQEQGQCLMTKDYCKYMGTDFKDSVPPDCKISEAQKWAEKFTGKTLFRGMKRGLFTKFLEDIAVTGVEGPFGYYELYKGVRSGKFRDDLGLGPINDNSEENTQGKNEKKDFIENFEMKKVVDDTILSDIFTDFSKSKEKKENFPPDPPNPPVVNGIVDDLYITEKKLVVKDFAGKNVNLYQLVWKNGVIGVTFGFIASEIESEYPFLIRKINEKKYIIILPELTRENNYIKRMYYCYLNNEWFSGFISSSMLLDILIKKGKKKG